MSATQNATSQSVLFDSSKAVSAQQQIDPSLYTDWTTAPVGRVVKDRLAGKVALITGASAGIGAVTARRLAAEGAKVVLFARREEKLVELVSAIKKSGGDAVYFVGDASSENDNKNAVDIAVKQFGGLHITFNNAGIARGLGQKPWETAVDAFNEVMASNVNGIFFAVKAQAPVISQSGGGVIINNASTSAFMPGRSGSTIYPASKAWVVSYTQHAASELAKIGVRINTISPGPTLSDVLGADNKQVLAEFGKCTAIGRALKPEEIAGTVAFLAADEAMAITGNDLVIDGGFKIAQDPSH